MIPVAVFGPARTAEYYEDLSRSVLQPGLDLGGEQSRGSELIGLNATDSQSFQELFHNLLHPDTGVLAVQALDGIRLAHWLVGATLTLVTLLVGAGRADLGPRAVIRLGALMVLMVAVSPASHNHYFCVNLPLVMGLVAAAGAERIRHRYCWLILLLTVYAAASGLSSIPALHLLRYLRLPLLASLALWLAGILTLHWRPGEKSGSLTAV